MVGIFRDCESSRSSRQEVQVVNVIARPCHNWVVPIANEHRISIPNFHDHILGVPRVVEVL